MEKPEPIVPRRPILRVLLVEDEADTADTQLQLLEALGFEAKACQDAAAALRVYRDFCPDVVLLDLGLPGIDGYELAKRLLEQTDCERPLLIALTGHDRDGDRQRSQEAGISHFLVKPAVPSDLLELLSREAERRGKERKPQSSRASGVPG